VYCGSGRHGPRARWTARACGAASRRRSAQCVLWSGACGAACDAENCLLPQAHLTVTLSPSHTHTHTHTHTYTHTHTHTHTHTYILSLSRPTSLPACLASPPRGSDRGGHRGRRRHRARARRKCVLRRTNKPCGRRGIAGVDRCVAQGKGSVRVGRCSVSLSRAALARNRILLLHHSSAHADDGSRLFSCSEDGVVHVHSGPDLGPDATAECAFSKVRDRVVHLCSGTVTHLAYAVQSC
jgi:hypothetical protein